MTTLGRNDPCHCGSGKKYKKCHLDADRRESDLERGREEAAKWGSSTELKSLQNSFRQLSRKVPAKDRKVFSEILAKTEVFQDSMARREEIEAASEELKEHREAFLEFLQDENRSADLAEAVFGEECFAPLRFTASEVEEAFGHVGYPAFAPADEQTMKIMSAAILHLADKERRSRIAIEMLSHLPEFVSAGRFMEGWLIQSAAMGIVERPEESNPLLFQMMVHGCDAWFAEKRAMEGSILRSMGFDLESLSGMDMDEVDALLQSRLADPKNEGLLEEFFQKHPQLRAAGVASLESAERNSTKLLEREDSHSLLLSHEEVVSWAELLGERYSQLDFTADPGVGPSEGQSRRRFEELAVPLMQEMAVAIFTDDRIRRLVADLKRYRKDLFDAGEKGAAGLAMGAITYVENEDSPGENNFLFSLCFRSLRSAIAGETDE